MFYKILTIFILTFSLTFGGEKEMIIYDYKAKDIKGKEISLSKYKGKTLLIVNVASKCGFTSQYEGLEALYDKYKDNDFMILGFPSNQFANQEPGTDEEIKEFCTLTYGVNFDMFSKIEVNGKNEHPLYTYLKKEAPGFMGSKNIKWNFTKFLVNKDGKVLKRYSSTTKPSSIESEIRRVLGL